MKRSQHNTGLNLKTYSALAAMALAATSASSQIVYEDIDPDAILEGETASLIIDLNEDGVDDFAVYRFGFGSVGFADFIIPFTNVTVAGSIGSGSSSYPVAYAINAGENIGDDLNWPFGSFALLASEGVFAPGAHGNWTETTDKYLGVRLDMGDHFIYGWVRMDIGEDGTPITVKDMAYNSEEDGSICAGDMYGASDCSNAVGLTAVTAVTDIADNENGLDLECTFNPVTTEDDIAEYRAIAVKTSASAAFDVAAATALGTDSYVSVAPSGLEMYSVNFLPTSKDSEGDLIVNDQPYHVFVLSVASGIYDNALSAASEEITLTTEEDTAILVHDLQQFISVYPNPVHSNEMLTAELHNTVAADVNFEITDITGNRSTIAYTKFENSAEIDISKLPAGVYFLKTTVNNTAHVMRFIKE